MFYLNFYGIFIWKELPAVLTLQIGAELIDKLPIFGKKHEKTRFGCVEVGEYQGGGGRKTWNFY